jgi:hypothetical protein
MKSYYAHNYGYQPETVKAFDKVPYGTIAHQTHCIGMNGTEPIIVILDSLIRYAKAHEASFGSKLSEDYFLGPLFLQALTATRDLLNGNGAVANEISAKTGKPCRDSKDNGACEQMFWDALGLAGFKEEDI